MTSDRLDSTALYTHNHVPKKRFLNALFLALDYFLLSPAFSLPTSWSLPFARRHFYFRTTVPVRSYRAPPRWQQKGSRPPWPSPTCRACCWLWEAALCSWMRAFPPSLDHPAFLEEDGSVQLEFFNCSLEFIPNS